MEKGYQGLLSYTLIISTFREYRSRRLKIMQEYKTMTPKEAWIYQWYIYSRPLLTEKQKEFIWNELNGFTYLEKYMEE